MVPAIAGQIGFLHFEDGRLVSLAYEPSRQGEFGQRSARREVFEKKASRIRNLRDTLLNVIADGDLDFVSVQLEAVLESLQQTNYKAEVDFSTLLYLGYVAFASQGARAAIPVLARYSQSKFGLVPFDFKIFLKLAKLGPTHHSNSPRHSHCLHKDGRCSKQHTTECLRIWKNCPRTIAIRRGHNSIGRAWNSAKAIWPPYKPVEPKAAALHQRPSRPRTQWGLQKRQPDSKTNSPSKWKRCLLCQLK